MWSILGLLLACSPSTRRGDHTITGYNYDKFSTDDYEFEQIAGPVPGQKAPDFELTTPSGNKCRLLDIKGDFLVLEMGSITCPLFQSRRGIMGRLSQDFPGVASSVLYVREAHPGAAIPSHRNFEEKQEAARRLKDEDGEGRLILVDDFDGAAHRAYGSMPNAVYIINRNGCVVFRADWNNPSATRKAIEALVKGREIRIQELFPAADTDHRPAHVEARWRWRCAGFPSRSALSDLDQPDQAQPAPADGPPSQAVARYHLLRVGRRLGANLSRRYPSVIKPC